MFSLLTYRNIIHIEPRGSPVGGFTLVELSIVLVILGLLVVGIFSGHSLIEATKVHAQVAQLHEYISSTNGFRLQYNGLPGDINNASAYWPGQGINGNSNGKITQSNGTSFFMDGTFSGEYRQTFYQLRLAGLLKGEFDGSDRALGRAYPEIKLISGFGMFMATVDTTSCTTAWTACTTIALNGACNGRLVMQMRIGNPGAMPNLDSADNTRVITALQASIMDRKMDDGIAATGKFCSNDERTTLGQPIPPCTKDLVGTYDVGNSAARCRPMVVLLE